MSLGKPVRWRCCSSSKRANCGQIAGRLQGNYRCTRVQGSQLKHDNPANICNSSKFKSDLLALLVLQDFREGFSVRHFDSSFPPSRQIYRPRYPIPKMEASTPRYYILGCRFASFGFAQTQIANIPIQLQATVHHDISLHPARAVIS